MLKLVVGSGLRRNDVEGRRWLRYVVRIANNWAARANRHEQIKYVSQA